MSECKEKIGSLQCEECDDWIVIKVTPFKDSLGVWHNHIEKCKRRMKAQETET